MRKNPIIALLLTVVMLFTVVAPTYADGYDAINNLIASGKMSDDEVYTVYVDMSLASEGSVTSTVYETVYEQTTVQNHAVSPQPYTGVNGAKDKLSRFFLFLSHNHSDHVMGLKGATPDETVAGYVYGQRKSEVINTYISGIVDCLGNPALWTGGSGGSSSSTTNSSSAKDNTVNENPDVWADKYKTTTFTLNKATYSIATKDSPTPTIQTMDVAPYVKNDRTYVPVRYLAYSLGVPEEGVTWDGQARRVSISKGNTNVKLTIDSRVMFVNKKPIKMDVSPEITSDRTMLPARWVAEALGAEVEWDDATKQAIIKMPKEKPGN
jgi:hypothetical protein